MILIESLIIRQVKKPRSPSTRRCNRTQVRFQLCGCSIACPNSRSQEWGKTSKSPPTHRMSMHHCVVCDASAIPLSCLLFLVHDGYSGDVDELMLWDSALSADGSRIARCYCDFALSLLCLEIRAVFEWSSSDACVCQLTRSAGAVTYNCSGRGLSDIPACVTNDATAL
jgi:hypothetical protein